MQMQEPKYRYVQAGEKAFHTFPWPARVPHVVEAVINNVALGAQLLHHCLYVVHIRITHCVPVGAQPIWDFLDWNEER